MGETEPVPPLPEVVYEQIRAVLFEAPVPQSTTEAKRRIAGAFAAWPEALIDWMVDADVLVRVDGYTWCDRTMQGPEITDKPCGYCDTVYVVGAPIVDGQRQQVAGTSR